MTGAAYDLAFAPLLPWPAIWGLAGLALAIVAYGLIRRARGILWRALAAAVLALALANPSVLHERREARPDIAVVLVDRSASQRIGDRAAQADAALERLRQRLEAMENMELRVVPVPGGDSLAGAEGTRLMAAMERALAEVPRQRLAAVFAITDGQVHDMASRREALPGPFHALITGRRGEADRRLVVTQAPSFGLVGKPVTIGVRVEDPTLPGRSLVGVSVRKDGQAVERVLLPANQDDSFTLTLEHGGQTVLEIEADPGPAELSLENNRAVVAVNGVRDRLRVLLVSGEPHAGERTWRNLLKADPSVDLIHFTILRPPEKQDGTPIRELSLISFPVRELFELKIKEFDLIILDRYQQRGILPRIYLRNIADYVRRGGALLEAVGPGFAAPSSLFNTPMGEVLPGAPTGQVFERGFRPATTEIGRRHPVTAGLSGAGKPGEQPGWGRWFRQVEVEARAGTVVMEGIQNRPVLILDRVEEGRVAHLLSDHIWLWTRGFEGGGPQAELLRRIAHWLMKEPELEENDLRATLAGNRLEITRRSLERDERPVEVTGPDGQPRLAPLNDDGNGHATGSLEVERAGLYRLSDGRTTRLVAVGALNPIEFADLRATDAVLRPLVEATGGSLSWIADGMPEIRRVRPDRQTSGRDWAGVRANGDYAVIGVDEYPLMPALMALLLALGTLVAAWVREGR
ncbi:MAG: membrane protein [Thalassobaculales bacterium]